MKVVIEVQDKITPIIQDEPLRSEYPYGAYGYPDLVNPYAHHAMSRWVGERADRKNI